ncbi:hypothetical protein [Dethiobacter alkaliphilus]|uniref:Uncharacterized protein n=1 Tax=Dethiobacter alkaliphilus AHT 1 TaxID=555088 RepID=C0GDA9_DETAL|nr:hypothetical protein [Dethiobacter alkaliphilus]EEG78630.1 hypothetical protein DealDRAFT_0560 [Dethiobacter alkaliphilus AHT 1]
MTDKKKLPIRDPIAMLQKEYDTIVSETERLHLMQGLFLTRLRELVDWYTINRKPKKGWEEYFSIGRETKLKGESVWTVRRILGNPPYKIRSTAVFPAANREIWVFTPYDNDSTGLYLYFKGNQLDSFRLDTFTGFYGSDLLDDHGFWQ